LNRSKTPTRAPTRHLYSVARSFAPSPAVWGLITSPVHVAYLDAEGMPCVTREAYDELAIRLHLDGQAPPRDPLTHEMWSQPRLVKTAGSSYVVDTFFRGFAPVRREATRRRNHNQVRSGVNTTAKRRRLGLEEEERVLAYELPAADHIQFVVPPDDPQWRGGFWRPHEDGDDNNGPGSGLAF